MSTECVTDAFDAPIYPPIQSPLICKNCNTEHYLCKPPTSLYQHLYTGLHTTSKGIISIKIRDVIYLNSVSLWQYLPPSC